jgi:predicted transposase YbfD/YdcC
MPKPQGFAQPKPAPKVAIVDAAGLSQRLKECFSSLEDPRVERTQLHLLSDIVTIAILSTIAGGGGWEEMELYGESKHAWLSTFLALPNGIPSADTFRRLFERLNPQEFECCFQQWVQQLVSDLGIQVLAIDGKSANNSYDRANGKKALHMVSAWASEHRLVLAQAKVQDKSNEITAVPALLELLDIRGSIVTLDAMGTQKTIATQIKTAGADYILALKANHPTLFQQVQDWLKAARQLNTLPSPVHHQLEAGHHRIENRTVWAIPIHLFPPLHDIQLWTGIQTIVIVQRKRELWNKTTYEVQFYLCSLSADSPRIAPAIRAHWGIENSLYWVLDVTFGEDDCRVRSFHSPQNLSLLRRFALNALNRETSINKSLRQKSKRAAMDDLYMLSVLAAALPDPADDAQPLCQ